MGFVPELKYNPAPARVLAPALNNTYKICFIDVNLDIFHLSVMALVQHAFGR